MFVSTLTKITVLAGLADSAVVHRKISKLAAFNRERCSDTRQAFAEVSSRTRNHDHDVVGI